MTQAADSTGRTRRALTTRSTAEEARENLVSVLRLCQEGKLRCSEKSRRPSAATIALVTEVLRDGDFYPSHAIAAFAWPLLVQAARLAELAGGRLQLTPRGRATLARSSPDALGLLWSRWLAAAPMDELSRVEHIKGQRKPNTLTAASKRRQAVGRAIAALPPGEWIQIDALFASMQRQEPPLRVARNDTSIWNLYIADPHYGSLGYLGFHDWPLLEGRYALCVLFEYAATLGLIDVAYTDPAGARDDFRGNWGADDLDYLSRYDGLTAVRRAASP
jgi:hypothetical protein